MAARRRSKPAERPTRLREARDGASFTREQVEEIQRSRVLGALREVVAEQGVAGATVAHIVAHAGVSRRTFYELFADREECFLAAFDQAVALAALRVLPAFQVEGRWRERVRAGLLALLALFDEEPELGALCVVHALGAGPDALERRACIVQTLAAAVDEGRTEARKGHEPAPLTAEGVVGAVLAVLHTRLSQPTRVPLSALAGPLMSMIALPYLGPAAADRELARPAPKAVVARRSLREDPLKDLDMRLTYRTVRVLLAIAEEPGASNRHVADTAGIVDQGQTSKLLRRLAHLGLVENAALADGQRGEPNAWRLTARGAQLQHTVSAQSSPQG
jgi:AcrR family transcriptional regulator/DNA-binding MarR family transcriptional regulator